MAYVVMAYIVIALNGGSADDVREWMEKMHQAQDKLALALPQRMQVICVPYFPYMCLFHMSVYASIHWFIHVCIHKSTHVSGHTSILTSVMYLSIQSQVARWQFWRRCGCHIVARNALFCNSVLRPIDMSLCMAVYMALCMSLYMS